MREKTSLPIKLDESIDGVSALLTSSRDRAADIISLKICRHGGLTGSRLVRDLAAKLGFALNIEDVLGSEITNAAVAHLAINTPPGAFLNATHYGLYFDTDLASGGASISNGQISLTDRPGLGLSVNRDRLGEPIFDVGENTRTHR